MNVLLLWNKYYIDGRRSEGVYTNLYNQSTNECFIVMKQILHRRSKKWRSIYKSLQPKYKWMFYYYETNITSTVEEVKDYTQISTTKVKMNVLLLWNKYYIAGRRSEGVYTNLYNQSTNECFIVMKQILHCRSKKWRSIHKSLQPKYKWMFYCYETNITSTVEEVKDYTQISTTKVQMNVLLLWNKYYIDGWRSEGLYTNLHNQSTNEYLIIIKQIWYWRIIDGFQF